MQAKCHEHDEAELSVMWKELKVGGHSGVGTSKKKAPKIIYLYLKKNKIRLMVVGADKVG